MRSHQTYTPNNAPTFNDRSCEAGKERQTTTLLAADDVRRAITRIAHEIVERDRDLSLLAIVGIRARGDALAARIQTAIRANEGVDVPLGAIDITLYRDDLTRIGYAPIVRESEIPFSVDGRVVVLVDDVLFTGRSIRAALDALRLSLVTSLLATVLMPLSNGATSWIARTASALPASAMRLARVPPSFAWKSGETPW